MIRIRHDGIEPEGLVADESLDSWLELGWEVVVDDPEPEPVWTPVPVATGDDPASSDDPSAVDPVTPSTPTPPKPDKGKES